MTVCNSIAGSRSANLSSLVIAIIGTLVSLLVPVVQRARAGALRRPCLSNLKQIGTALLLFHDAARNFLLGEADDDNSGWNWRF